jgi:hypothetical protein
MSICQSCDRYEAGQRPTCRECGCDLLLKLRFATEECPLKKWLATKKVSMSDFKEGITRIRGGCGSCGGASSADAVDGE